jgi:hypothetical protein
MPLYPDSFGVSARFLVFPFGLWIAGKPALAQRKANRTGVGPCAITGLLFAMRFPPALNHLSLITLSYSVFLSTF